MSDAGRALPPGTAGEPMDKSFDPAAIEGRWYAAWEARNAFAPRGDGEPYCIMLPPPNVTGRLHMGHAFQHTLMDALVRFERMRGRRVLWQCGTDHAGIATQMVVERQLAARGKHRRDLGRDAFVDAVWRWKGESGGFITGQMRQLGDSVDWSHERFTMDEGLSAAVRRVFVALYEEGLIYRGKRLVNWDPVLQTALSDLEVISEEEDGHLWHLRYPRTDGQGHLVVATTRPETMLGDTAVAVHPEDERFASLVGGTVELPLTGRRIPVIADAHVDPTFGSGCVKITPAHDFDDYEVGRRHDLPLIAILTPTATLNDTVPEPYRGLDRFEARRRVVDDLEAQGLMERIEKHRLKVPRGDRSQAVLEPLLTDQWFVDLTRDALPDGRPGGRQQIALPAIDAVRSGRIRFVPANWDKTYFDWMTRLQDWCISRQLWWGHRIPAWYDEAGGIYVGDSEAAVRAAFGLGDDVPLRQDEDVLDTWFSSALWPFSTLGWPEKTERLATFYPTSVLVTGFDIIFFWVARMIMMGLKFMGDVPFREVYIHGLVRDAHGQKMSKSKGNILDPIDLVQGIDLDALVAKRTTGLMQPQMAPAIEKATREEFPDGIRAFGTDALRFTFAALATQGRDVSFDVGRIAGYRNFCNKLWNAARFVLSNAEGKPVDPRPDHRSLFDRWILARLDGAVASVTANFEAYRFDLAAQAIYEFTWNEYCDWYLELTKPVLYGESEAEQRATRYVLLTVLETLLRLAHPIIPFITEEIWQRAAPLLGLEGDTVSHASFPAADAARSDDEATAATEWFKAMLLGVRQIRGETDLAPSRPLPILLEGGDAADRARVERLGSALADLGRFASIRWLDAGEAAPESAMALVGALKIHVPLAGLIDPAEEIARLEKERERRSADRDRAAAKLANERFVANAPPEVVAKERQKHDDAVAAIRELDAQLERLRRL